MAIYMWREPTPITTAGIYHNSDLWLISLSSDGTSWLTIADKNLWATTVWDYWNYYQWGNNYWWATNATTKSSNQVNAWNYWPWNYYNSSTFITWKANTWWDSSNNANLRWWTTWTVEAMQWPCPSWYHIPSYTEFSSLSTLLFTTFWLNKNWWTLNTYLKLPANWYIGEDGNIAAATQWQVWYYFSSSNVNARNAFWVYATDSSANLVTWAAKALWQWIRPFANTPTQPDTSWTKLY